VGIGPRDDARGLTPPGVHSRFDLPHHLDRGNDLFTFEVAAPLGKHLVLELDGARSGPLQQANGSLDIQGIAVAGVGVHDEGNAHRVADAPHMIGNLGRRRQPDIRHSEIRVGDSRPGHVHR
jgi:hypothetical protein